MRKLIAIVGALCLAALATPAAAADLSDCGPGLVLPAHAISTPADLGRLRQQHRTGRLIVVGANLAGQSFAGLDLPDVCFVESDLSRTNWRAARGDRLKFVLVKLEGSDWSGFHGRSVAFSVSWLTNARMAGASLPTVKFSTTALENADLTGADLRGGSFSGNWSSMLTGARFDRADMRQFRFTCGTVSDDYCGQNSSKFTFRGTDLRGAVLDMPSFSDLDFTGARIGNTRIHWEQVTWFSHSRIEGAVILTAPGWTTLGWRDLSLGKVLTVHLSPTELRQIWAGLDEENEPGFSCVAARSEAERYICDNRSRFDRYVSNDGASGIAERDRALAAAFLAAKVRKPGISKGQRLWLAQRDACMAEQENYKRVLCFDKAYVARTEHLWALAGEPSGPRRGESFLYIDSYFPTGLRFRKSALFRKLAPIMVRNSWQYIVVRRDSAGRIHAIGESVGGNGHIGGIFSPPQGLSYDSAVHCFVGRDESSGETFPVIRLRGRMIEPGIDCPGAPGYNQFVVTGARAGFRPLERIELTDVQFAALRLGPN